MNHSSEIFDKILNEIHEQGFIAVTKDSEHPFDVVHRLEVENLIDEKNHVYRLTRDGYKAIELGGFVKWLEYVDTKQNATSKNLNVFGNLSISDSKVNLLSDNSTISTPDEVLNQLGNMVDFIRHSQNIDNLLKAKLIDMYVELNQSITVSKDENCLF